ncbi:MAG: hypothetical protein QW199_02700 [Candidatus Pacearchaeota archaeon]
MEGERDRWTEAVYVNKSNLAEERDFLEKAYQRGLVEGLLCSFKPFGFYKKIASEEDLNKCIERIEQEILERGEVKYRIYKK